MTFDILLVVIFSALTHAGWNTVVKGTGGDPLTRSAGITIGGAVLSAPLLIVFGLPAQESWIFAAASAAIHVAYAALVGLSYRKADLSVVYPIIRGTGLIMSAVFAALLLGDRLPPLAWAGVMIVALGVGGMATEALLRKGVDRASLFIAAVCASSVMSYTLVDGAGVRLSGNPLGYVSAMLVMAGVMILPVVVAVRGNVFEKISWRNWAWNFAGGAMFALSYGAALWAIASAPIGLVAAVRETSVLFGAIFATLILGEKFGRWRWLAAAVIVTGLVITRLARG